MSPEYQNTEPGMSTSRRPGGAAFPCPHSAHRTAPTSRQRRSSGGSRARRARAAVACGCRRLRHGCGGRVLAEAGARREVKGLRELCSVGEARAALAALARLHAAWWRRPSPLPPPLELFTPARAALTGGGGPIV
eukprot:gene16253-biopygen12291